MTRNNVHDPVLIDTVWGSVAVFGHELVSKKDLVILGECLSLPEFTIKQADHRVRSVVFRADNRPCSPETGRPILANCSFDAGAICINLQETFRVAVSNAKENEAVSVVASFHRNMILSFLHEIHHLAVLDGTPDNVEEAETEAEEWAWARLVQLAQTVNVEPAHFSECSFLNGKLSILNSSDDWSKDQYSMMDHRVMYTIGLNGYFTFKGYIRLIDGGKESNPLWSKTIPIDSPSVISKPVYVKPVPEYKIDEQVYIPVQQPAPPSTPPTSPVEVEYEEEEYHPQYNNYDDDDGVTYEPIQPVKPPVQPPVVKHPPAQQPVVKQATVQSDSPLSADERAKIVIGVYERCNAFIFDNCGQVLNSDQAFENPEKVMSHGIPLSELERSIIVKMDCQDVNGRWCPTMSTTGGMLFGGVMKNTKLPYYKLFINMGAGVQKCRLLLPQNPAKLTIGGEYTFPAQQTRAGNEILYINEGDDMVKKKNKDDKKSDFYFKVVNRVFMKA
ncbi:MAG: hypothetical protein QX194_00775 [Methylococcales bacterium]